MVGTIPYWNDFFKKPLTLHSPPPQDFVTNNYTELNGNISNFGLSRFTGSPVDGNFYLFPTAVSGNLSIYLYIILYEQFDWKKLAISCTMSDGRRGVA